MDALVSCDKSWMSSVTLASVAPQPYSSRTFLGVYAMPQNADLRRESFSNWDGSDGFDLTTLAVPLRAYGAGVS